MGICVGCERRAKMSDLLPVRGKQISCASCSVQRAAGLLQSFLSSDAATEAGMSRGYIETVAKALDDMMGRQKHMSESGVKNVCRSTTGGLTFGHPGEAEVVGIVGVKKRLKKTEVKKTKQKAKTLSDFEALLGSEIGTAKVQETPGSDKKNKKKRKGNHEDGDVQA